MNEARRQDGTIVHISQTQIGQEHGYTCIGVTPDDRCQTAMRACALASKTRSRYFRALGSHHEECSIGTHSAGTKPGVAGDDQPIRPPRGQRLILTLDPIEPPAPGTGTTRRTGADPTVQVGRQIARGEPTLRATLTGPEALLRALLAGSVDPTSQMPKQPALRDLAPVGEVLVHANSLQAITLGSKWFWGTLTGPRARDRYEERDGWTVEAPLARLVLSVTDRVAAHLDPSSVLHNPKTRRAHFLVWAGQEEAMGSWNGAPGLVISTSTHILAIIEAEDAPRP